MSKNSMQSAIDSFKLNDKKFNGLFSVYSHFFNIMDKNTSKIDKLFVELKSELARSNCDRLHITDIDISFVLIIVRGLLEQDNVKAFQQFTHFFAMLKWFYKNDRKFLENSQLYDELSKTSRDTVVIESNTSTHEKLRFALKSIDAEPKFMQVIMDKAILLPSYHSVLITLWGILRNIKNTEKSRQVTKMLKSEEACCVIQALFDKFCSVDVLNNFKVSVDSEKILYTISVLIAELTEDLSQYVSDFEVEVQPTTDYSYEELETINRELKAKYKELRTIKYMEDNESNKESSKSIQEEMEASINEKVYKIDFGLSLQQKKDLLSTSNFLLLKSDDIKIVNVMDNIRIESIITVANEVLRDDYDAVVILTKNIGHKHTDRVKSLIGYTPLIYTNHTNRRLIIEDIYNQF